MPRSARSGWLVLAILFLGAPAFAQTPFTDPPAPLPPTASPTDAQRKHQEGLRLYADGLLDVLKSNVLTAIDDFERAAALEPKVAATQRALIELYTAALRPDDALAACRAALAIDPDDGATWYVYAGQLREHGRLAEATKALENGVACSSLKHRRDLRAEMYFELACLYDDAQDAARAEPAYREVIKILRKVLERIPAGAEAQRREGLQGKLVDTYERIIRVCSQAHRYDRAIAAFEEARQAGLVRSVRLNYQIAQVYLDRGDSAKALTLIDEYLQTQPAGTEAYELRNAALQKLGRDKEILPSLEGYAARDAHNVALHLLLARQYEKAGQTERAERLFKSLADESPGADVYAAWFGLYRGKHADQIVTMLDKVLGQVGSKHADPGAAAKARAMLMALGQNAELTNDLIPAGLNCPGLSLETLRFLAALAARSQQLAAADQYYRSCLDHYLTPENQKLVYGGLLEVLWESRRYVEIIEICSKALDEMDDPAALPLHRSLAVALAHLGRTSQALAEADKAIASASPDDRFVSRLTRIEVLRKAERYPEAVDACQALLKESAEPKQVRELHLTLSNIYSAAHDSSRAEQELRTVLAADPDDATANNDLGYLLADENRSLGEAETMIRKALQLEREQQQRSRHVPSEPFTENAAYLDSLGWVLFRQGHVEEARGILEKVVTLPDAADDPIEWDHLAEVYAKLKRPADARRAWEKALSLYDREGEPRPDEKYREIKEKLQRLGAVPAR